MEQLKNILLYLFAFSVLLLHPSLNNEKNPLSCIHYLAYGNTFKLKFDDTIDKDKLYIKWTCENQNADCKELDIFIGGKKVNTIPFESGKQELIVYYNNKMIGKIKQTKTKEKHAHAYFVNLSRVHNNAIEFKGEITGPSSAVATMVTTLNNLISQH
ncbi:MAG TPA: hypothetical protein VIN73_01795 [Vicingaceae bacterium]